jgi:hypothetical protein
MYRISVAYKISTAGLVSEIIFTPLRKERCVEMLQMKIAVLWHVRPCSLVVLMMESVNTSELVFIIAVVRI